MGHLSRSTAKRHCTGQEGIESGCISQTGLLHSRKNPHRRTKGASARCRLNITKGKDETKKLIVRFYLSRRHVTVLHLLILPSSENTHVHLDTVDVLPQGPLIKPHGRYMQIINNVDWKGHIIMHHPAKIAIATSLQTLSENRTSSTIKSICPHIVLASPSAV